jgi:hypothetical protein
MFVICIWLVIMNLPECVSDDSKICYLSLRLVPFHF